jgi:hypothetical protein
MLPSLVVLKNNHNKFLLLTNNPLVVFTCNIWHSVRIFLNTISLPIPNMADLFLETVSWSSLRISAYSRSAHSHVCISFSSVFLITVDGSDAFQSNRISRSLLSNRPRILDRTGSLSPFIGVFDRIMPMVLLVWCEVVVNAVLLFCILKEYYLFVTTASIDKPMSDMQVWFFGPC